MTMTQADATLGVISNSTSDPKRFLFGPIIDFFCLGGSSLIILPLLLVTPAEPFRAPLALGMLLLTNVINHPHFAHSYQLFYRNFRNKAFSQGYNPILRARYIFAGIAVPALLALFLGASVLKGDAQLLGYAGNLMVFFVGWHYVKQGYGMLMVDAALKRQFFTREDKKILLINSYTVWFLSWLTANAEITSRELWGLTYYSFHISPELLTAGNIGAIICGLVTLRMFARRWKHNGGTLPFNGVVAYAVTLYAWILFVRADPLWLLVTPALHSLQYLVVVWRYEANYQKDQPGATELPTLTIFAARLRAMHRVRFMGFVVAGLLLGFLGFWAIPSILQKFVTYDQGAFGAALFLFIFWIFINVHHYFLDNVIWRRDNPEVRRYLFSH